MLDFLLLFKDLLTTNKELIWMFLIVGTIIAVVSKDVPTTIRVFRKIITSYIIVILIITITKI